ncbi:hypothetical protein BU16DRAFT_564638 [Lophium mytilinum]|uniref:Uncharacterized protein n=1 Tax=Lophium mytilinum TaxID=390894 RepID=A0A6A6QIC9_9PEZI|nr:hypothetical protein BU16DRAFT_564638 [Lophium mytilinum]
MSSRTPLRLDPGTPFTIKVNYNEEDQPGQHGEFIFQVEPSSLAPEVRCSHLKGGSTNCESGTCYWWLRGASLFYYATTAVIFECENRACAGHPGRFRRCDTDQSLIFMGKDADPDKLRNQEWKEHNIYSYEDGSGNENLDATIKEVRAERDMRKIAAP